MAKLPDVQTAFGPARTPGPQRAVQTVRNPGRAQRAVASAAQQAAAGIERLGDQVVAVAEGSLRARDEEQLAYARSAFLAAKTEADNAFDDEQDYTAIEGQYSERMQAAATAAAEKIESTRVRSLFEASIEDDLVRGREQIKNLAQSKENDFGRANLDQLLSANRQHALASKDEPTRAGLIKATRDAIEASRDKGYLSAEEAVAKKRRWTEDYAEAWLGMQDPERQLELIANGGSAADFLPEDRKAAFRTAAQREIERQSDKRERLFLARLDNYVEAVSAGANIDPALQAEFSDSAIDAAVRDERTAALVKAQRDDAVRMTDAMGRIRGASPEQQAQILEQLQAEAEATVGDETALAMAAQNRNQFSAGLRAVEQDQKARIADAAEYVLRNDAVTNEEYRAYAASPDADAYSDYAAAREAAFERMGIPATVRKPLSKAQAKGQVALITDKFAQNPEDAAAAFSDMAGEYGRDWPRVLGQLTDAGLPGEAAAIAYTDNASAQQTLVMAARAGGIKAIRDQIEKTDREAIDTAIMQDMAGLSRVAGSTNPAFVNTIREGARTIAHFMTLSGTAPETAAMQAMDAMFNEGYRVVDQPNVQGVVPRTDVDIPALTAGADAWLDPENMPEVDILQFAGMGNFRGLTAADAQNTARAILRNNGVWYLNADGSAMTLTAPGLGMPVEVLDANGNPVTVRFSDIEAMGRSRLTQRGQMQSPDDLMMQNPLSPDEQDSISDSLGTPDLGGGAGKDVLQNEGGGRQSKLDHIAARAEAAREKEPENRTEGDWLDIENFLKVFGTPTDAWRDEEMLLPAFSSGRSESQQKYDHISARGEFARQVDPEKRSKQDWVDIGNFIGALGTPTSAWEKEEKALKGKKKN